MEKHPTDHQVDTAARVHYAMEQELASKVGARRPADFEALPDLLQHVKRGTMARVLGNYEATKEAVDAERIGTDVAHEWACSDADFTISDRSEKKLAERIAAAIRADRN